LRNLKNLVFSSILSFPTEDGEFILDTDAANHGIGAVLSQVQKGKERVLAYYNRVFNKAERNYCITRRELLTVVESLKTFHHYLYGWKFQIRTDHISLHWLISFRNLEGQMARWLECLQQYDFEIKHQAGKMHGNADALSRRPCTESFCNYCKKAEECEKVHKEKMVRRISFLEGESVDWAKA